MHKCLITWLHVVFALFIGLSNIGAETIVLQNGLDGYMGTEDNSIYEDRPNHTNGGGEHIFSGATTASMRRALIRFDLSSLPDNIQITNVTLELRIDRSGRDSTDDDEYRLHRLLAEWGEGSVVATDPGGIGSPAEPGDATWDYQFFEQDQWETPGGDFAETASIVTPLSRQPGTTVTLSSDGMVEDVETWLSEPENNFGWILIGDENGTRNARRFNSSENESNPPKLIIEFQPNTAVNTWEIYE